MFEGVTSNNTENVNDELLMLNSMCLSTPACEWQGLQPLAAQDTPCTHGISYETTPLCCTDIASFLMQENKVFFAAAQQQHRVVLLTCILLAHAVGTSPSCAATPCLQSVYS
jgi:hypothetical protein